MSDTLIIKTENISKAYSSLGSPEASVLKSINLELYAGDSLAIVGPSGSGKSTLLNMLGTLDTPSSGRVLIDGVDTATMNDMAKAELRNRRIGFVFQLHHLLPQCTVLENVLLPVLANRSRPDGSETAYALHLLERVGIADCAARRPGQLSGGECQRTALVRALINKPGILLADEPTGSLDKRNAAELAVLLAELNREQTITLVVVTHSDALAEVMKQTMNLADGRLAKAGS
jgi:lipoprotein-releasing system ATP-binding protein